MSTTYRQLLNHTALYIPPYEMSFDISSRHIWRKKSHRFDILLQLMSPWKRRQSLPPPSGNSEHYFRLGLPQS